MSADTYRLSAVRKINDMTPGSTQPHILAVAAHTLGVIAWSDPSIEDIIHDGEDIYAKNIGFHNYIPLESRDGIIRGILSLAYRAGLTPKERAYILQQIPE